MRLFRVFRLSAFLLAGFAWAQGSEAGSISGHVKSPNGTSVSGASVEVINTATAEVRTIAADNAGVFRVPDLQSGKYKIVVHAQGYQAETANEVEVRSGTIREIDVALRRARAPEARTHAQIEF